MIQVYTAGMSQRDFEKALRRLKALCNREGVFKELKVRRFCVTKSNRRKWKMAKAESRRRRTLSKKAKYNGNRGR